MNDGTTKVIDLGSVVAQDVSWSPPDGHVLLIRGHVWNKDLVDLYSVRPDGSDLHPFGLPGSSSFGQTYTLSGSTWSPDGKTIACSEFRRTLRGNVSMLPPTH